MFHLSLNATHCLLILDPLGGSLHSETTKQTDGSVHMFDPLHYDN
jgi:hypothetical protein